MQPTDGCFVVRIWKIPMLTPSSGAHRLWLDCQRAGRDPRCSRRWGLVGEPREVRCDCGSGLQG